MRKQATNMNWICSPLLLSPFLLLVKREARAGRLCWRLGVHRSVPSLVPPWRIGIASSRSAFRIVPYRRSFAPFLVSDGGASGGKRLGSSLPFARPSHTVGTVSPCSPLCSFRLAKSAPRSPCRGAGREAIGSVSA